MAKLTGRKRFAHLYRRAGFGATEAELQAAMALYRDEDAAFARAVDRLLDYESAEEATDRLEPIPAMAEPGDSDQAGEAEFDIVPLVHWWLERMLKSRRPLLEKMVLFWHNHFATSAYKDEVGRTRMLIQHELFRANALGSFEEILHGVSRDPAMIGWLDLDTNRKGHPNENYVRELMELFTLGVGPPGDPNYTEADIREAARAFTGYTVDDELEFEFRPGRHDHGTKTVLGRPCETGDDVNAVLLRHEKGGRNVCSHFLAAKLFSYFAYPVGPDDPVVAPLAARFVQSGFSVRALVEAILRSGAFSSETAYRALVKSPVELLVGTLRLLGAERVPLEASFGHLWLQGQVPFAPPNVGGWPSGRAWINSSTVLSRNALTAYFLYSVGAKDEAEAGGRPIERQVRGRRGAAQKVDRVLELVVDGDVPPAARSALVAHAANADDLYSLFNLALVLPAYQLN